MSGLTTKRKASSPPPCSGHEHDAASVARALDNVTRIGATFATAASNKVVLPAIAFKGDDEPLSLPLRKSDVQQIKTRGAVAQRANDTPVAWHVGGELLEARNPRWRESLDEIVETKRKRLAIAPSASIGIQLKSLVVAEPGARLLERPRAGERGDGVFGTLLVVLPGSFTGGQVDIRNFMPLHDDDELVKDDQWEEHEDSADCHAVYWRREELPGEAFDLVCAAFHDCCEITPKPIESGAAVYLVYDLVTTTAPALIRFYAGPEGVQHAVDAALTGFFKLVPPQLKKRLKIGTDVWRTITEFIPERPFAYAVNADTIEDLDAAEARIAQSLAAFCAERRDEYVLYFADALCSRLDDAEGEDSYEDSVNSSSKDRTPEMRVTLTAPWFKFDEPGQPLECPPVFLDDRQRDVAPVKLMEQLQRIFSRSFGVRTSKILEKIYTPSDMVRASACVSSALVVLPKSLERRQIAKLPIPEAMPILRALLSQSHNEAFEYAQRILLYRPDWDISYQDETSLAVFVDLLIEINDRPLFEKLLQAVNLQRIDKRRTLWKAVEHFGFSACAPAILQRIRTTPTLGGRIYLVLAMADNSLRVSDTESLLDELLSLSPWTDVPLNARRPRHAMFLSVDGTSQLLESAYRVSPRKAIQTVSVTDPVAMVEIILPALLWLHESTHANSPLGLDVLAHAFELFKDMKPEIRNHEFAKIHVEPHCARCDEVQSFLLSTATETSLQCADDEEMGHVRKEFCFCYSKGMIGLRVDGVGGTSLRLVKEIRKDYINFGPPELYYAAKSVEKRLLRVLSPETAIDSEEEQEHD